MLTQTAKYPVYYDVFEMCCDVRLCKRSQHKLMVAKAVTLWLVVWQACLSWLKVNLMRSCPKRLMQTLRPCKQAEWLAAFYAALRGELKRGLLFGKRRRDKFDA